MARSALLSAALLFGAGARAAYSEFFFATEESNWKCPDMVIARCVAPQACAYDNDLKKHVCCDSGDEKAVCWGDWSECNERTINCGNEENRYCCLANKEECTKTEGQINICWSTNTDSLAVVSHEDMNQTFSSLLSESSSATYLTLDLSSKIAATSTPGATTSTTSSSTGTTPTDSPSSSPAGSNSQDPNKNDSKGVSAGAIAGGVVGGVLGLALLGGGILLLMRRKRAASGNELDGNPYTGTTHAGGYTKAEGHYSNDVYAHEVPEQQLLVEMPVNDQPVEVEGSGPTRR